MSTLEQSCRATPSCGASLAAEITAVFPSTTATALTTLATGEWPARHAVTGWWTHLPDIDGDATILEFTRRSDGRPLEELGVRPDRAFPAPPIAPPAERDVMAVVPNAIASTVFSTYSFGEERTTGYDDVREAGQVAVSRALRGGGRTSTYLYFPHVDAASHYYGMSHETTFQALRQLDAGLAEMARALRGRARIVVTADHGHLDAAPEAIHWIVDSDPLMRTLSHPPSGDYRAVYLRPREGLLGEVRRSVPRAAWRAVLPGRRRRGGGAGAVRARPALAGDAPPRRRPDRRLARRRRRLLPAGDAARRRAADGRLPLRPDPRRDADPPHRRLISGPPHASPVIPAKAGIQNQQCRCYDDLGVDRRTS